MWGFLDGRGIFWNVGLDPVDDEPMRSDLDGSGNFGGGRFDELLKVNFAVLVKMQLSTATRRITPWNVLSRSETVQGLDIGMKNGQLK